MKSEANKAKVGGFIEKTLKAGNLEIMNQILSPDFFSHEAFPPGMSPVRAGVKQLFGMLRNSVPDIYATTLP